MPVTRSQVVSVGFGAAHSLKGHPRCDGNHGHYYTVHATFSGVVPDANWGEILTPESWVKVVGVIRELANRDLNKMLPAGYPNPNGVAAYLLERLTMHGATKVEVHESDTETTGIAERVPG